MLFVFCNTSMASVNTCKSALNNINVKGKLDILFQRAFKNPKIYKPSHCAENSIRLFRFWQANLDNALQMKDFKIHYIARPETLQGYKRFFFSTLFARELSYKEKVSWRYHVVIEYDGDIYDMDYTNTPRVLSARDYFSKDLIDNTFIESLDGGRRSSGNKLRILTIPGEDFFWRQLIYVWETRFIKEMHAEYGSKVLNDYIMEAGF